MDASVVELLRRTRREAGLTQAELARRAGISQPVVAAYESGRRQPTVPMLRKLLAAAGRQLDLQTRPLRRLPDPQRASEHLLAALGLVPYLPARPRTGPLAFPRLPLP